MWPQLRGEMWLSFFADSSDRDRPPSATRQAAGTLEQPDSEERGAGFKPPKPQGPAHPTKGMAGRSSGRPRERVLETLSQSGGGAASSLFSLGLGWARPSFSQPPSFHNNPRLCPSTEAPVVSPLLPSHFLLPALPFSSVLKIYRRLRSTAAKTEQIQPTKQDLNCMSATNDPLLASVSLGP